MRIRLFDRILLTVYTLITILASLLLILLALGIAIGVIPPENLIYYIMNMEFGWQVLAPVILVAVLFLLVGTKLLFSGINNSRPRSTLLKNTDLGVIKVSINTLDTIAQKAVKSFKEIRDVKSIILTEEDGIKVQLKILVMPEVVLPDLTQSIQKKVKEYVESLSGILVKEVQIYVDNLSTPQGSKVE